MKLVKAMATVGGFTLLSRVVGMVRDMLTAAILGVGPIADAFIVALRLPNFFRSVTAEGAFSVSFVPLYAKTLETEGEEDAAKFAGQALTVMSVLIALFSALMMIGMPWVLRVIAPGFDEGSQRFDLAVEFTRITFPYLLFMSATALFGGVLNANHRLGPFAAAPILFNLMQILALTTVVHFFPTVGHALAWAVCVSGVLQVLLMVFFLRRYQIKFLIQPFVFTAKIKKLFSLMGPGILAAGILQVNLFVDVIIASTLPEGSIGYLYYADRLNQLPIGIIGAAVATALLPMLSRALAAGHAGEANRLFNRSFEYCMMLALPAAVAMMVVPEPLISGLYEYGAFKAHDVENTARVLAAYAIGIPAYLVAKVFQAVFWSKQDTTTPVKISLITVGLNIALGFTLSRFIGVAGIALATGLVAWVQFFLLRRAVRGEAVAVYDNRLKSNCLKIVGSVVAMAATLVALSLVLAPYFHAGIAPKLASVVTLVAGGGFVYALGLHMTGALTWQDVREFLTSKKKKNGPEL